MIDKLFIIKKLAQTKGINIDIQIDDSITGDDNKELKDYMVRVSLVQSYIKTLKLNTVKLENLKTELPNAFADKEKEYSISIDQLIEHSLQLQQQIKVIIDTTSSFAKECDKNPMILEQEKRIIANMQGSIIKNFQDAVTDYQMTQSEIKNIKQNITVRNAEIVMGRKLENDEKENIINDPKIIQDMLRSKLLDPASKKFANALSDIEDRHNDIIKLEKSVNQVHQLFLQLAALVNLQGEIIEDISDNIARAKDDVFAAEEDVIKSKNNMMSARKKKCIIIGVVVALLVFIVFPMVGFKIWSV